MTHGSNGDNVSFERIDDAGENLAPKSLRWNKTCGEMHSDFISYTWSSKERCAELVLCVLVFALGHAVPGWLEIVMESEVSAPYQVTSNGDVIVDLGLNFPLVPQTVPDLMLIFIAIVLPILLLVIVGVCLGPPGDAHASLCAYFLAVGITSFVTDTMKVYCAKLRPNFYSMCEFDLDTKMCVNDKANAHKSFPSGHSSLSFCGMTIISLYFLGKVGLHRLPRNGDLAKNFPSLAAKIFALVSVVIPQALALFVASSRVHDSYHHPADIVTGALIGACSAHFTTSVWYPSVYSNDAGYPLQFVQSTSHRSSAERELEGESVSL